MKFSSRKIESRGYQMVKKSRR